MDLSCLIYLRIFLQEELFRCQFFYNIVEKYIDDGRISIFEKFCDVCFLEVGVYGGRDYYCEGFFDFMGGDGILEW